MNRDGGAAQQVFRNRASECHGSPLIHNLDKHTMSTRKRKRQSRVGSKFEDFLRKEERLEEATAVAIKRVLAWEIQRAMTADGVTQAEMARRMKTSRAVVRRVLDAEDSSVTLATISRAAAALGRQFELKLAA